MKISDDFQPEKKIEDFQLNENKNNNTEYASWWDDVKKDFKEIKEKVDTGIYYIDEGQKKAQREVWKFGAQKLLREQMGCETSAWMLEHSLQDNPSGIWRGNDSRIAYLVNNDKAYLKALDEKIRQSRNGKIKGKLENVVFDNGDLYYSIHKSDIYVNGYRQENGKWIIKAKLEDEYDFTEIMTLMGDKWYQFSTRIGLGTLANDVAFFSQKLGAINPYKVEVEFYTTR